MRTRPSGQSIFQTNVKDVYLSKIFLHALRNPIHQALAKIIPLQRKYFLRLHFLSCPSSSPKQLELQYCFLWHINGIDNALYRYRATERDGQSSTRKILFDF